MLAIHSWELSFWGGQSSFLSSIENPLHRAISDYSRCFRCGYYGNSSLLCCADNFVLTILNTDYLFIVVCRQARGDKNVQVLLFDCEAEAKQIWRSLAEKLELRFEAFPHWDSSAVTRWDPQLIILDQTAIREDYAQVLSDVALSMPNRVLVATGESLSVGVVADIMRDGVDYAFEKPLRLDVLTDQFDEMVQQACKLSEKQREFQSLQSLFSELTHRERDVLEFVMEGTSNKDTAEHLKVSVRTIEARRAKVYLKTQSSSVVDLVRKVDRLARLSRVFSVPRPRNLVRQSCDPITYLGRQAPNNASDLGVS